MQTFNATVTTSRRTINNSLYAYYIHLTMQTTAAGTQLRFYGCRIRYSYTQLRL